MELNSTLPPSLRLRHLWPIADRVAYHKRVQANVVVARYKPRGVAALLQVATDPELLLSGPAGTGKSRACLEKLHAAAAAHPRFRGLIVRKTRESASESALFTYEEHVLGPLHPLVVDGPQRRFRQVYRYDNGARIVVGGLDKPSKIMSTEFDMIYVQEATELDEADWLALTTRLRNHALPHQQLIADCNPDAPTHWLYLRCQAGHTKLMHSRHEDNPVLYDGADWTSEGRVYLELLDRLGYIDPTTGERTGAEYRRLRLGLWVQASGLVYGVWADGPPDGNVTEAADYEDGAGSLFWFVDDGYAGKLDPKTGHYTADSHPRVFLLVQQRGDGTLCVFAEHYAVETLSDDHIEAVQALPYPPPDFAAVDKSAAELKGRLHTIGVYTRNGPADVEESIKEARRALALDKNGRRRVLVHPRCTHLRSEMTSYRRDPATGKPVKQFDHGPDALRYGIWTQRFEQ